MSEPLDWTDEAPRSRRFDDIYFSPADGLAETQEVFLRGCGLPDAWTGRLRFTVGELGFGTGLNILALIDLWRRTRPHPTAILHIFSLEAFPMARTDAARALSGWPELAALAEALLADWPGGRRGFQRIEWPDEGAILDLAILEAEAALTAWSGHADAWFLDGFAPSKNPEMWRPAVLNLVAERSSAGARLATFSVAGAVRRGLEGAGFSLSRAPGFGRKKERLEARLPVAAPDHPSGKTPDPSIAIIGAGIAGAALARAFQRLGQSVEVFDVAGCGAGASGNPSALVAPRLDAGLGPNAELHAQAFLHAVRLYRRETPAAIIGEGALQLVAQARDAARFQKIAGWNGYDPGSLTSLDPPATAAALGEDCDSESLLIGEAMVAEPQAVLAAWLPNGVRRVGVARLEAVGGRWRLIDGSGATVTEVDVVCLAAGPFSARLAEGLRLRPVRGQASFTNVQPFSGVSASWSGYAVPMRRGVLFGATHDRDDWEEAVRPEDDARNLESLRQGRPALAALISDQPLSARASLRAMTPDYLPLAGAVPGMAGVYALSGLGGRGFTLAPLLAEAVAAEVLGAPTPLPRALAKIVDPGRFG